MYKFIGYKGKAKIYHCEGCKRDFVIPKDRRQVFCLYCGNMAQATCKKCGHDNSLLKDKTGGHCLYCGNLLNKKGV